MNSIGSLFKSTTEKNEQDKFEWIVLLCLAPVLLPILVYVHGFVLMKLWGWFMVPRFDLPGLSAMQAYGLMLTIRFVTWKPQADNDKGGAAETVGQWIGSIAFAVMILGLGWIIWRLQ